MKTLAPAPSEAAIKMVGNTFLKVFRKQKLNKK